MSKSLQDNKKRKIIYFIMFIISAAFYLIWLFHDGVIMSVDGPGYVEMDPAREPLYPFFLWLFRTIFGLDQYLFAVCFVQCVIAGLAATAITMELQHRFELPWISTIGILFAEYGITLINRLVAQRKYSYYNSICTEAVAYSFWIFFLIQCIRYMYDRNKKNIVIGFIWCTVMVGIRKQMLVSYCLLFLLVIVFTWNKIKWKSVVAAFVIVLVGLLVNKGVDTVYYAITSEETNSREGDSTFIFGNEIYVADPSMVVYLSTPEYQEIFLEILRRCDDLEYNVKYSPRGWMEEESHYSSCYDRIKFDIGMGVVRDRFLAQGNDNAYFNAYYEPIANQMTKELLIPCLPDLFHLFCINTVYGMVNTIMQVHRVLNYVAAFAYVCFIGLIVLLFVRAPKGSKLKSSALAGVFTLVAITGIVCFTSLTIYCQNRYVIYCMAFFYQIGIVMLTEFVRSLFAKR